MADVKTQLWVEVNYNDPNGYWGTVYDDNGETVYESRYYGGDSTAAREDARRWLKNNGKS